MGPRRFRLGDFFAQGERFRFHPETDLAIEVDAGEEFALELPFSFVDDKTAAETLRLALAVEIPGLEEGTVESEVRDEAGKGSDVEGALVRTARIARPGTYRGEFALEAHYARRDPRVPAGPEAGFAGGGTFTVRVR